MSRFRRCVCQWVRRKQARACGLDNSSCLIVQPPVDIGIFASRVVHQHILRLTEFIDKVTMLQAKLEILALQFGFVVFQVTHPFLLLLSTFAGCNPILLEEFLALVCRTVILLLLLHGPCRCFRITSFPLMGRRRLSRSWHGLGFTD